MNRKQTIAKGTVTAQHGELELGRFARQVLGISSRQLQRVVRTKGLYLNGKSTHSKTKVQPGDVIEARLPLQEQIKIPPAAPDQLTIIYEDDYLLAADKPAGLKSYSVTDSRGLANQVAGYFLGLGLKLTPRPLHRLDTPTSGIVIFAKDAATQTELSKLWQGGKVERFYWSLCHGRIDTALDLTIPLKGQKAHTIIKPLKIHQNHTELEVELITGRTHQIRQHLAKIGHPLVGERRYQKQKRENIRLALHAASVRFPHPDLKQQVVEIVSQPPREAFEVFFTDQQPL